MGQDQISVHCLFLKGLYVSEIFLLTSAPSMASGMIFQVILAEKSCITVFTSQI